jgi:hypothetical protein
MLNGSASGVPVFHHEHCFYEQAAPLPIRTQRHSLFVNADAGPCAISRVPGSYTSLAFHLAFPTDTSPAQTSTLRGATSLTQIDHAAQATTHTPESNRGGNGCSRRAMLGDDGTGQGPPGEGSRILSADAFAEALYGRPSFAPSPCTVQWLSQLLSIFPASASVSF